MDNTESNNKLIAEFIGFQFTNIGWFDAEEIMSEYYYQLVRSNTFENLQFDRSWDWLMPVVIKCFDIEDSHFDDLQFKLNDALLETNINSLYIAVVEYIKEYNKFKNG